MFFSDLIILLIQVNSYLIQKLARDWYICMDSNPWQNKIKLKQIFLLIKH